MLKSGDTTLIIWGVILLYSQLTLKHLVHALVQEQFLEIMVFMHNVFNAIIVVHVLCGFIAIIHLFMYVKCCLFLLCSLIYQT